MAELIERHLTGGQVACSMWLMPDGSTRWVKTSQSDHEKWLASKEQLGDECPGKPDPTAMLVLASGGHFALDTLDGWPMTGDYWYEMEDGEKRLHLQTGDAHDWAYALTIYVPIDANNATKKMLTLESTGNRIVLNPPDYDLSAGLTLLKSVPGIMVAADQLTVDPKIVQPAVKKETTSVVPIHHSVAFDATATGNSSGSTTSLSFSITLVSVTNGAIGVGLSFGDAGAVSSEAVTIGGSAAALVTGTLESPFGNAQSEIFARKTADLGTGSKTVSATWTTNDVAIGGAISVTGCDQTTPMNNGTSANTFGGSSIAVAITSTSGDLTMSVVMDKSGPSPVSTDQTERWRGNNAGAVGGGGDNGPGTGTTTHTWTLSAGHNATISGANFLAAAAAAGHGPLFGFKRNSLIV